MTVPTPSARAGVAPGRPLLTGPLGARLLAGSPDTAGGPAVVVHDLAPRALPRLARVHGLVLA